MDAITPDSACFQFDAVLAAYPAVFSGPDSKGAFMFCDNIPFTIQLQSAFALQSFNTSQAPVPPGPCLTENRITDPQPTPTPPSLVVETNTKDVPWSYQFVRGTANQILIYAFDGTGGMGWLTLASNAGCWGRKTSCLLSSQALAEAHDVTWGVVFQNNSAGAGVSTQVFLLYADSTTGSDVLLMTCIGGNDALVGCDDLVSTAAVVNVYHGAYDPGTDRKSSKSPFLAANFTYNAGSMEVNLVTAGITPSPLASWQLFLVGGAPSPANVGNYINRVCMSVVDEGCACFTLTPPCAKCTVFTSLTPRGLGCLAAAAINPDEANAAYQTLCGIDPVTQTVLDPNPPSSSAVMSTPDCMCMNYTQSPFVQPGLPENSNYRQFQQWISSTGASFKSSGNTMCWLPSCIASAGSGAITYNWPVKFDDQTKYTGTCPNSLYCIDAVNAETENGGAVTVKTLNQCTQSGDGGGGGPTSAPSQAPSNPPAATKLTDSLFFRVAMGALIIAVLMTVVYFLFKPVKGPAVRYVVVAPTPTPTPGARQTKLTRRPFRRPELKTSYENVL